MQKINKYGKFDENVKVRKTMQHEKRKIQKKIKMLFFHLKFLHRFSISCPQFLL